MKKTSIKIDVKEVLGKIFKSAKDGSLAGVQKIKKADFKCPLCGSRNYMERWVSRGSEFVGRGSYPPVLLFYKCDGCSVIFGDPIQFSQAKQLKEKRCGTCSEVKDSVKERSDRMLPCGRHCDECFQKMVEQARKKSW